MAMETEETESNYTVDRDLQYHSNEIWKNRVKMKNNGTDNRTVRNQNCDNQLNLYLFKH